MAARAILSRPFFVRLVSCATLCAMVIALVTCGPGGFPTSSFTSPLPSPRVTPPISPLPTPTPGPQEDFGVSLALAQPSLGVSTTLTVRVHSPVDINGASLSVSLDGPKGVSYPSVPPAEPTCRRTSERGGALDFCR